MLIRPPTLLLALACAAAAVPAWAQYKIVAPDGSITYTDRPRADAPGKVSALGRGSAAAAAAADSALPFELRQVAARFPVTLYAGENCVPCDNGRQFLQQRGVPYSERRIAGSDDQQALDRLVGGRTIPALTIGAQPLRGFSPNDWGSFLDAAGYPRESKLPRSWQPQPPTPLAPRAASAPATEAVPAAAAPAAPARPADAPQRPAEPQQPGSIRF